MSTALTIEQHGHVALLEIQRPPENYFDVTLLHEIAEAGIRLQTDGNTRALVLASAGKHFSAGANFATGGIGDDRQAAAQRLYTEAIRLFDLELPMIAAVQGSAVGGGLGLACAADFRVATASSRFTANFAALGFHHGFGLSATLPRILGLQRAQDLLYTGRRVGGEEALELGLVDRIADEGDLRTVAIAWATQIADNAPLAVRAIRRTLRASLADDVRGVLGHELAQQAALWATKDSAIGIAANLARQKPSFVGA